MCVWLTGRVRPQAATSAAGWPQRSQRRAAGEGGEPAGVSARQRALAGKTGGAAAVKRRHGGLRLTTIRLACGGGLAGVHLAARRACAHQTRCWPNNEARFCLEGFRCASAARHRSPV